MMTSPAAIQIQTLPNRQEFIHSLAMYITESAMLPMTAAIRGVLMESSVCMLMNLHAETDGSDALTLRNIDSGTLWLADYDNLNTRCDRAGTDLITIDMKRGTVLARIQVKNKKAPYEGPDLYTNIGMLAKTVKNANAVGPIFHVVSSSGFTNSLRQEDWPVASRMLSVGSTVDIVCQTVPDMVERGYKVAEMVRDRATLPPLSCVWSTPVNDLCTNLTTAPPSRVADHAPRSWASRFKAWIIDHVSHTAPQNLATPQDEVLTMEMLYLAPTTFALDAYMGAGKTMALLDLVSTLDDGERILVIVSGQRAVDQCRAALMALGTADDADIHAVSDRNDGGHGCCVVVCTLHRVNTVLATEEGAYKYVVVDESTRMHTTTTVEGEGNDTDTQYRVRLLQLIQNKAQYTILASGTPCHGIDDIDRVFTVTADELIRDGHIVDVINEGVVVHTNRDDDMVAVLASVARAVHARQDPAILLRVNTVAQAECLTDQLIRVNMQATSGVEMTIIRAYGVFDEHLALGDVLALGTVIVTITKVEDSFSSTYLSTVWPVYGIDSWIAISQLMGRAVRAAPGKTVATMLVSIFSDDGPVFERAGSQLLQAWYGRHMGRPVFGETAVWRLMDGTPRQCRTPPVVVAGAREAIQTTAESDGGGDTVVVVATTAQQAVENISGFVAKVTESEYGFNLVMRKYDKLLARRTRLEASVGKIDRARMKVVEKERAASVQEQQELEELVKFIEDKDRLPHRNEELVQPNGQILRVGPFVRMAKHPRFDREHRRARHLHQHSAAFRAWETSREIRAATQRDRANPLKSTPARLAVQAYATEYKTLPNATGADALYNNVNVTQFVRNAKASANGSRRGGQSDEEHALRLVDVTWCRSNVALFEIWYQQSRDITRLRDPTYITPNRAALLRYSEIYPGTLPGGGFVAGEDGKEGKTHRIGRMVREAMQVGTIKRPLKPGARADLAFIQTRLPRGYAKYRKRQVDWAAKKEARRNDADAPPAVKKQRVA